MSVATTNSYHNEHRDEAWSIRYFCAKAGLLNKDLAKKSGLTQDHINKIFRGENINRTTMIKVCRAIGVARWKVVKFAERAYGKFRMIMEMEKKLRQEKDVARRLARGKKKRKRWRWN